MPFRVLPQPFQNPFVRNIAIAAVVAAMLASILLPGIASAAEISVGADKSAQVNDAECLTAHATEVSHTPHGGNMGILAPASTRTCANHLLRVPASAAPQSRSVIRPPGHGDIP